MTSTSVLLNFTIQLHDAKRAGRHFDLRLEHNNVMVSWATRKLDELISSTTPMKIVLFPTPDHDMTWHNWEGKIEKGYGAGNVVIWDKGLFEIIKWTDRSKVITFYGKKIKGTYAIILTNYGKKQYIMLKTVKYN